MDILSTLDDAIDRAPIGLPEIITPDELLDFSGLAGEITKTRLGRLLKKAGVESHVKKLERGGTATRVYLATEILAAIRNERAETTPEPATTQDSVSDQGSGSLADQVRVPYAEPWWPKTGEGQGSDTGKVASEEELSRVRDELSGTTPAPRPKRTVAVTNARRGTLAPVAAHPDAPRIRRAGAVTHTPKPVVEEAVAAGPGTGVRITLVEFPVGTPDEEIRRVSKSLGLAG